MKINCIVFGLSGLDTAPIVRAMKEREEFGKVVWFGTLPDADINTFEAYKYHTDYDYSIVLPKEYLDLMQEALGSFVISDSRRNEVIFNAKIYTLDFGSTYDCLHRFSRYCYLIYELITKNQINLILIDAVPHTSIDILLCKAAKYFNIKMLFLYQPNIPNRFMYFSELKGKAVDFSLYYSDQHRPIKHSEKYVVNKPRSPFYMSQDFTRFFYDEEKFADDIIRGVDLGKPKYVYQTKLLEFFSAEEKFVNDVIKGTAKEQPKIFYQKKLLPFLLRKCFSKFSDNLDMLETLSLALLKFVKYKKYEKNLASLSQKTVDMSVPYVYFPFNCQPELTTECLAGFYIDILSAVEKVRCLIPRDWKIYVKDHVIQYEFARDKVFFERLKAIPNTFMVDRSFSSFELIKNSQFVSNINGTAGWEAIQMGKKALNFGTIYYQGLPGIFTYTPDLKLEDILSFAINKNDLEVAISNLIGRMEVGIINADYSASVANFDEKENARIVLDFISKFFYGNTNLENMTPQERESTL